jgi:hypothetical protein
VSQDATEAIRRRAIGAVLLFSPRTAAVFRDLVTTRKLEGFLEGTAAICLSGAVAEVCQPLPWSSVRVAARPDRGALLDQLDAIG